MKRLLWICGDEANPPEVCNERKQGFYPICGKDIGEVHPENTYEIIEVFDCKDNHLRYEQVDLGNLNQCGTTAPPAEVDCWEQRDERILNVVVQQGWKTKTLPSIT